MFEVRKAEEGDCDLVASLMNAHNSSVDQDVSHVNNDAAMAFVSGYFEPNAAVLLSPPDGSGIVAAVNLHPDTQRERFQIELFCDPTFEAVEEVVRWTIENARLAGPGWELWPGANAKDERAIAAWAKFGFETKRRFTVMRLNQSSHAGAALREDISISAIDVNDDAQLRIWHSLHQDAFSTHYGFTARPFDDWIKMVTRDPSFDPSGVLVGYVQGEAVGFCHHTDEFASDNRGFVIGLGVARSHQGHGYGEALLEAGVAYAATRGYTSVELAVDSGNESGALNLYSKCGFQVTAAWVHLGKSE